MNRLTDSQVSNLHSEMVKASQGGDKTFEPWYNTIGRTPTVLEFPSHIIAEPEAIERMGGFLYAWRIQGKITLSHLEKTDRFPVQGLERKISIALPLSTALLCWVELPDQCRQIRCRLPRSGSSK